MILCKEGLARIIETLDLRPLDVEGGLYFESYRSPVMVPGAVLGPVYYGERSIATAIYYLITLESFSLMHRIAGDEIFHLYAGGPVDMLILRPDHEGERVTLGTALASGERPQVVVPGGAWQGSRLCHGADFALMGVTMSPGFDWADYEHGRRAELIKAFPEFEAEIRGLTRED